MDSRRVENVEAFRILHEAALRGDVPCLIQLLEHNPLLLDQIMVDGCSETPLHVAALLGHTDFVREILNRKKELALEQDNRRRSPLHLAAGKGYVEIVEKLLSKVDPHSVCGLQDDSGRTPLHMAAIKGRDEVLKVLIHASKESLLIRTHREETILHLAVKYNYLDTLKLLVQEVPELLSCKDVDGNTLLHLAVADKQIETVKYLVQCHLDVGKNVVNNDGLTPVDVLQQSVVKEMEISDLLGHGREIKLSHPKETNLGNNQWAHDMKNSLLVVAVLLATVAFQAITQPAGGLWNEENSPSPNGVQGPAPPPYPDHEPGDAIMDTVDHSGFRIYFTTNTVSFASSISIIMLLISGISMKGRIGTVYVWILMGIVWVAITSMVVTYIFSVAFLIGTKNYGVYEDKLLSWALYSLVGVVAVVIFVNLVRLCKKWWKHITYIISGLLGRRRPSNGAEHIQGDIFAP